MHGGLIGTVTRESGTSRVTILFRRSGIRRVAPMTYGFAGQARRPGKNDCASIISSAPSREERLFVLQLFVCAILHVHVAILHFLLLVGGCPGMVVRGAWAT